MHPLRMKCATCGPLPPLRERVKGLVHGTNSLPKPSPQAGERKFAVPLCKN